MVRAVDTRWNSLVEAIERAIYLEKALNKLLALAKYKKPGHSDLSSLKLSDREWLLLKQLQPILHVRSVRMFNCLHMLMPV